MQIFHAYFVGSLEWFSERKTKGKYKSVKDALKAHLKYISRSAHTIEVYGISFNRWKALAEEETSRRWDARVAGKFFLTLPNELTPEKAIEMVKTFLEGWIGTREYTIALHHNKGFISGEDNLHAHIIFYPRDEHGRRISFDKERLRQWHIAWKEILQKYGYIVPEVPNELKRKKVIIDRKNPDQEAIEREREEYLRRKETLRERLLRTEEKTASNNETTQRIIKNLKINRWEPNNIKTEKNDRTRENLPSWDTFL